MKHILKKAVLRFVFLLFFSLLAELVILPLLLTTLFSSLFPSYVSFFTDWSPVWIAMVAGSLATSLVLSFSAVVGAVWRGKAIVNAMSTSGINFDEALIMINMNYRYGEDPKAWNVSHFTEDLWTYRARGHFN